jgi:hypothetical protein
MDFMIDYYLIFHSPQIISDWLEIYKSTPVYSFLFCFITVLFYYYFINLISSKFNKMKHWLITTFIAFATFFIMAIFIVINENIPVQAYEILFFALINAITFLFVFVALSLLLKCWSPNARFTPTKLFCK